MGFLEQFKPEHIDMFLQRLIELQGDYLRAAEVVITEINGGHLHWGLAAGLAEHLKRDEEFQARYANAIKYLTISDKKEYAETELKKIIATSRDEKNKIEAIRTFMKLHQLDAQVVVQRDSIGDWLHSRNAHKR